MSSLASLDGEAYELAANDNVVGGLVVLIQRATFALESATSAAEVLDARDKSSFAYDNAKRAQRLLKAKGAHDDLVAKVHRAQADALELEAMAKRRLADEYDAAQERGEVAERGKPVNVSDGNIKPATAADIGLSRKEVHEARILRDAERDDPGVTRRTLDAMLEEGQEPTKAAVKREITSRLASFSGDNEWYTPAKYIELAREVLGTIDVDPASNPHAQATVKAATYYTEETNGLDKEWRGRVWMNPPYSHPEIAQFAAKVVEEVNSGRCTEAIVLTNNSGDTRWAHALKSSASRWCVTEGRIQFESLTRKSGSGAVGQIFFYFGSRPDRFKKVFESVGSVEMAA